MMIFARTLLAILLFQTTILAANDSQMLTTEAREAFTWFDKLEFPDVSGKPFVLATTSNYWLDEKNLQYNERTYGYLLSENENSFTVLTSGLTVNKFQKSPLNTPERERVGFAIVNLEEAAQLYLDSLKNPHKELYVGFLNKRGILFGMAWGCWKNGLNSLAQSLFELAKTVREPYDKKKQRPDIMELMEQDIGREMLRQAVLNTRNPSISRPELLKRFERIAKYCSRSQETKLARSLTAILRRMVREDEVHQSKSLETLPMGKQVSELIYQLRDQNGCQFLIVHFPCNIFDDPRGENSPAQRLVKIGLPAAPQLLKALGDERVTRSEYTARYLDFPYYILRISDAALSILEEIARQPFRDIRDMENQDPFSSRRDQIPKVRARALVWWKVIQLKGERNYLIENVVNGKSTIEQAAWLISQYPDSALPAIVRGIQNAKEVRRRTRLVNLLSGILGDVPAPYLLQEMNDSPFLEARVAAAHGLQRRSRPEAVPAMIREWKTRAKANDLESYNLLKFLSFCNRPEAIRALADGLKYRRSGVRSDVIDIFNENSLRSRMELSEPGSYRIRFDSFSETVRTEIETMLVAEIEDTVEANLPFTLDQLPFDQRHCDIATAILAKIWPEKYKFDISTTLKNREKQRIECINVWRKGHGMEEMSFPTPRPSADYPNKVIEVLFADDKPNPEAKLASDAMSGKILTSEDFVNLFLKLIKSEPEWIGEVCLQAIRYEDLAGVTIKIEIIRNETPLDNIQEQKWRNINKVTSNQASLVNDGRAGNFEGFTTTDNYQSFKKGMEEALKLSLSSHFSISLLLETCSYCK
jgi:hypothetical protein